MNRAGRPAESCRVTAYLNLTRRNSMHKLITLLLALLMVAVNAFAAVNVNTASEKELQMLTGIGPAKAKAIIDYRTKNGDFKAVDDLTKVPGIGPAVLGKIKSDVTLTGPTTSKAAAQTGAPATRAATPPASEAAKPTVPATPAAAPAPAAAKPVAAAATPATPAVPAAAGAAKAAAPAAASTPAPVPAKPAAATPPGAPAAAATPAGKAEPAKSAPAKSTADEKKAAGGLPPLL
jgi:competence protein ComEA